MYEELGRFIFLAAGAIALFSFLSVGAWAGARATERIAVERLALYRKLAESPSESVELVLAKLREEDEQRERKNREKARHTQIENRQFGVILLAVGPGLSVFLKAIAPNAGVWTLGIPIVLIGLVVVGFSFVDRRGAAH